MTELDHVINNVSKETLTAFCRTKSGDFRPSAYCQITAQTPDLFPRQCQQKFTSVDIVGYFPDMELFVFAIKLQKGLSLSERSCRKMQFDYAKLLLKKANDTHYDIFTKWLGNVDRPSVVDKALFVFSDDDGSFRFSLVEVLNAKEEEAPKRYRRYTFFVDPAQANRTFKERMAKPWASFNDLKDAFSVEALNKEFYNRLFAWYEWACNDPRVEYPNDTAVDSDNRHDINQHLIRLLTRLIFVWFLKQKNLVPEELFDEQALDGILQDFDPVSGERHNYYRAILQNLFFATLNKEIPERSFAHSSGANKEHSSDHGIKDKFRYQDEFKLSEQEVLKLFSSIPFLNGGLFECLDHCEEDKVTKKEKEYYVDGFSQKEFHQQRNTLTWAHIPNEFFFSRETWKKPEFSKHQENVVGTEKGLIPLLKQYNFTVDENANDDENQEVALDPELLGKVFENLLASYNPETKETARKSTGSFYTPREIVNYMVDESLKAYLIEKCGSENEVAISSLFDKDANGQDLAPVFVEKAQLALQEIKVLDPACGSGAFPMGMLHRLLDLHTKLHKDAEAVNPYQLKLDVIENCIYGVDIQPIAVQISKLRFFISLVCEQDEAEIKGKTAADNYGIRALPNLETKFVAANSLVGLKKDTTKGQWLLPIKEVEDRKKELWEVRHQLFAPKSRKDKLALRKKDKALREELAVLLKDNGDFDVADAKKMSDWDPYDQNQDAKFFDPEWMFNIKNGFNIVIGNPPYIQIKGIAWKDRKYYETKFRFATGRFNIFYFFLEIASAFTHNKGLCSFIVPDRLMLNTQCQNLRNWLLTEQHITDLVTFNESVFETPVVDSVIISYVNHQNYNKYIRCLDSVGIMDLNVTKHMKIPFSHFINSPTKQFNVNYAPLIASLIEKIRRNSISLGSISDTKDGIIQGAVEDTLFLTKPIDENSKKLLFGENITKYYIEFSNNWVNYNQPEMMKLEIDRRGKLRPGLWMRNPEIFERNKILTRQTADEIIAAYDTGNHYYANTLHGTEITDNGYSPLFVLGVLNSKLITWYYRATTMEQGKVFAQIKIALLRLLPIPKVSVEIQEPICSSVTKLISLKSSNPKTDVSSIHAAKAVNPSADIAELERDIDEKVYKLYGLTSKEDIAFIEASLKKDENKGKSQLNNQPPEHPVTAPARNADADDSRD